MFISDNKYPNGVSSDMELPDSALPGTCLSLEGHSALSWSSNDWFGGAAGNVNCDRFSRTRNV